MCLSPKWCSENRFKTHQKIQRGGIASENSPFRVIPAITTRIAVKITCKNLPCHCEHREAISSGILQFPASTTRLLRCARNDMVYVISETILKAMMQTCFSFHPAHISLDKNCNVYIEYPGSSVKLWRTTRREISKNHVPNGCGTTGMKYKQKFQWRTTRIWYNQEFFVFLLIPNSCSF